MTPASVLSTSKNFHRAFELCYGNGLPAKNGVSNAIVPAVVCLAFSIELGFKAILVGSGKPSEGHKFFDLFGKLPVEIQAEIQRLVVGEDEGFESSLTLVSNAFVEWRYIFEEPGYHSIDVEFLSKLHDAVTQIAERYVSEQRAKLLATKA
ncbi:hypothetical protein [Methylophilus sp. TWE2]|uniref:hypothetical protein n=1 Tax=Methylophilus sp. TWE2 TaxID=1662285 RepID=UPI0006707658|nr:hypothetical protein [Methylophilus sp. TWE2]AKR43175.1 hypothetical protein ACJ67_06850 [Methylophilus sp. TWE2]